MGPRGWLQVANFALAVASHGTLLYGLSCTPYKRIRTRFGSGVPGVTAIGILGAAVFPHDPVSGAPPERQTCSLDRPTSAQYVIF